MSLNQIHAIDPKTIKNKGKLFGSIDFESKPGATTGNFNLSKVGDVVGTLQIGGREFDVSLAELRRIAETCTAAQDMIAKKYRFGR